MELVLGPAQGGQRLDVALTAALGEAGRAVSRTRVRALIEAGAVAGRAGTIGDPSERVKAGERLQVTFPPPVPATAVPEDLPLVILFEDDQLIVIDKPAGLVVHPAPGHPGGTLVNALLAHCGRSLSGIGGVERPGIVHRLDKETSGVLVVAKTDLAHRSLADQFASHGRDGRLHRVYRAVVWGAPLPANGTIAAPLGRSPVNRKKFAVVSRGGKPAVTHFHTLARFGTPPVASLLECRLETGRTHQIRVHLASLGHSVFGDPLYGGKGSRPPSAQAAAKALGRQALHAAELGFEHPLTGRALRFKSPDPADFRTLVGKLERL